LKNDVFKYAYPNKARVIITLINKYFQAHKLKLLPVSALNIGHLLFFDNLAQKPKAITMHLSNYIKNQLMKTRSFFTVR